MSSELRERLQIALGSAYSIEGELGGGGMSRVFVATETALARKVVVKVLPPELSGVMSAERFRREIQFAARLHHPHIVPVLMAGEADGLLYYTMPFVDGESLRSRLEREGELPIADAVRLLRDVTDALGYAHAHEVVHRDLKPDNILLSGRHALVTDFGVAKALSAAGASSSDSGFTSAGVALGTPAYMAPEQAAADPQADHRVDLYALGVVAYEVLTGTHPFAGRRTQALLAAHAIETPEPISKRRASVPAALATLVERLLAKRPADRPSTAEQVLRDLDSISISSEARSMPATVQETSANDRSNDIPASERSTYGARRSWRVGVIGGALVGAGLVVAGVVLAAHRNAPTLEPKRVVVASFTNKSGDKSLDPLGAMAADWIARGLTRTGLVDVAGTAAEVAPRSNDASSERATNTANIEALAEEARAGLVISGAYYRQGDSVLLQADFTDANTHRLLQSVGPIAAPLASPLRGVELLRQRVTGALAAILDPALGEVAGMTSEPPSYDAYSEFLQGEELFYANDSAAVGHYRRAAALDSTYLFPLLRALSALTNRLEWRAADSLGQMLDTKRALLSPYEGYYLDLLRAVVRHDPHASYASAHAMMRAAPKAEFPVYLTADEAIATNRPREALALLSRLDPQSGALHRRVYYFVYLCSAHHALGSYDRELSAAQQARRQYPNRLYATALEIPPLAALGKIAELEALLRDVSEMSPDLRSTPASVMTKAVYELRAHDQPQAAAATAKRLLAWLAARSPGQAATKVGRFDRAWALLAAEDWSNLRPLADSLVRENAGNESALGLEAIVDAQQGDRAGAQRAVDSMSPDVGTHQLEGDHEWRAIVAAALGDKPFAQSQLEKDVGGGVPTYRWHNDILYELMRKYPPFVEYLRPKG